MNHKDQAVLARFKNGLWTANPAMGQVLTTRTLGGLPRARKGLHFRGTWATPRTITGGAESAQRKQELGRTESGGGDLQAQVEKWPTPAARDAKGANSAEHALVTGGGRKHMDQLANFVEHSPSSPQAQQTSDGPESSASTGTSRRRLNPMFGAWLMGWPCWWTNPGITNCGKSAMESYRFRLRSQLSSLLGEPEFSKEPEA